MVDLSAQIDEAKRALRLRLEQAALHILALEDTSDLTTMALLGRLSSTIRNDSDRARLWLLMACVSGALPTREQLIRGDRLLSLSRPGAEHLEMLRACGGLAFTNENFCRTVRIVSETTIIDVDFCARHGHNTGVQRVVRETAPRWNSEHAVTLVAWTEDGFSMRSLIPAEETRVLAWTSDRRTESSPQNAEDSAELLIPWKSTIVLPEVAQQRFWARLACLAEFSSNTVSLIGYDAIPVTSAEYVIPSESDRFVRYLSVVKYATHVIGISESSSEEFAGFADSLSAQGLEGPRVSTVSLPIALARAEDPATAGDARNSVLPLVLCVGTQEPRKNQLAVLAAAEMLWKKGVAFELLFIGGAAMPLSIPFDIEIDRLSQLGRTVSVIRNSSDAILERAYREARFTMFVSLHEGFGLPIGESLAAGTPVIATNYGSMAEIASAGGCLMVDPRDDETIADAMELLLADDELLASLEAQALNRESRSWDDYSRELWNAVHSKEVAS